MNQKKLTLPMSSTLSTNDVVKLAFFFKATRETLHGRCSRMAREKAEIEAVNMAAASAVIHLTK
ncbi:hypothetical protein C0J52_00235 [Blattella germanica]|nr:hypothetical protein C0J52_00235 [Blattella germanica]